MSSVKTRRSKQREVIKEILFRDVSHPTAEDIYEQAREIIPDISLGTVYRNLKLLSENGVIHTVKVSDNIVHYDGNLDAHHHMVCDQCGKIVDVKLDQDIFQSLSHYFAAMDLQLRENPILFHGICKDCQSKLEEVTL